MSNEIKIEFLWNCAKALKSEQQTHKLLKSYYINTCRKLAKNNLQVPKEKFALSQMCPYCGSFWNESEFELKSIPKQLKLTSKDKKLIESYEKRDGSGKTLSRTQKNRAKWLMKRQYKSLKIKCLLCKHKSSVNMENERNKSQAQPPQSEKDVILPKRPKHVQNASKQKVLNVPDIQPKSEKKDDAVLDLQPKSKKEAEKQKALGCNKKTKSNKSFSNKVVISNTKKQNSLLQLAALLKKQTNVDTQYSSQKKLQNLLK